MCCASSYDVLRKCIIGIAQFGVSGNFLQLSGFVWCGQLKRCSYLWFAGSDYISLSLKFSVGLICEDLSAFVNVKENSLCKSVINVF